MFNRIFFFGANIKNKGIRNQKKKFLILNNPPVSWFADKYVDVVFADKYADVVFADNADVLLFLCDWWCSKLKLLIEYKKK